MRANVLVPSHRLAFNCRNSFTNTAFKCLVISKIQKKAVKPCRTEAAGNVGSGQSSSQGLNEGQESITWVQSWSRIAKERSEQMKSWGLAGVISYGLLKTLYYSTAFLVCWYYADIPRGMGISSTIEAFCKVFAMVWAGSQVTKLARYAGAAAMSPFMDKALESLVTRFSLKGKKEAFFAILALCLGVAACVFGSVLLAWS
ncbi:hypothetical protein CEUSTIGMA_g7245.t1 [Chlamydomonas eustigma]|uniref:Uncharacterized protein n=1 Tax=Chlamydomonas eustigma TaxID=1157962 RepID=A0A250X9M2_9CHLO|nr:hypothetical protein CEUSTIGMA_g7245.t1 [Chlamydomonas eustigma]|eukprot:GAX79805.1 hypothetical protein CEUSTIGMA_g7245.t1 [Chlamydomonas eustigma]